MLKFQRRRARPDKQEKSTIRATCLVVKFELIFGEKDAPKGASFSTKKAKFNTKLCIRFGTKTTRVDMVPEHDLKGPKSGSRRPKSSLGATLTISLRAAHFVYTGGHRFPQGGHFSTHTRARRLFASRWTGGQHPLHLGAGHPSSHMGDNY